LKEDVNSISETWQGPKCQLTTKIKGDLIEISGSYEKKLTPAEQILSNLAKKEPTRENISYQGKISGYGAMFQLYIWEGDVPLKLDDKPKSNGLLIIEESKERIRIFESGTRKVEDILEISIIK
jgi:hypothetical protein